MIASGGQDGILYVAANSDSYSLNESMAPVKIPLGPKTVRGRGCGGKPERGREAAAESLDEIMRAIAWTGLLVIVAGMGGGTGSAVAPAVAGAVRSMARPPYVAAVVTTPFAWEKRRKAISDRAVRELAASCDAVHTLPNEDFVTLAGEEATLNEVMATAAGAIRAAVRGIVGLIPRGGP
jgi:cell division protein FtsZ